MQNYSNSTPSLPLQIFLGLSPRVLMKESLPALSALSALFCQVKIFCGRAIWTSIAKRKKGSLPLSYYLLEGAQSSAAQTSRCDSLPPSQLPTLTSGLAGGGENSLSPSPVPLDL
ncbi:unnamed protein product [Rangifer tarandus platyrhynchus]|uniref:Uncharacterized protein n=2 Tax=Rangifer tarandus platyrhynchus TaxID=3082113 RepID=A0AC60A4R4_RANTA|nr:unnamed protein product [Rangifer tarandus platyrhynchus]